PDPALSLEHGGLRHDRGERRRRRGGAGKRAQTRPDPDGHPDAGNGRLRGHAAHQGRSGAEVDPGDRRHLLRAVGRRGEGAQRRLRRLHRQALQPAPDAGQGTRNHRLGERTVRQPARILVVDDVADNVEILRMRLGRLGYEVEVATDGEQALAKVRETLPDLILLDIMMPKIDGLEVVRRLKADATLPFIPVVLVTAKANPKDVVAGLDAGGDDYLTKPIDHGALVARVRAMLRIKALHDEGQTLNAGLEAKVQAQVEELERVGRLARFLAPQLAQAIVSAGDEKVLENHRREIVALFCDLRGFTAFSETAEPEDIMMALGEYHGALGPLIRKYEGTLDRF